MMPRDISRRPKPLLVFREGDTVYPRCLRVGLLLSTCVAAFVSAGCERKERVIDIRTPGADVKVDRNIDTGAVEVKTDKK
jgi:hypothetical protein